jgi:hypothetical protein
VSILTTTHIKLRTLLRLPGISSLSVVLFFLFSTGSSYAVEISSSYKLEQTQLSIGLKWKEPVKVLVRVGDRKLTPKEYQQEGKPQRVSINAVNSFPGRKLILRFDQAIEAKAISNLPQNVPDWIEDIYGGFDSIAIKTSNQSNFEVFQSKKSLLIKITALEPSKDTNAIEELRHLKSSLLSRKPKFTAHSELAYLVEKHPKDPQILADMAGLEERLGRWRESMNLYAQSLELKPGNRGLYLSRSYLQEQFGPQVRGDQYYQDTEDEEVQWVTRLLARQTFFKSYLFGVEYENRVIDDNQIRPRLDGNSQVFDGNRDRWETFVERSHGFAHTRFSILGQEDEVGTALQHRRELKVGKLFLKGSYNEPYWDLAEGLINQGSISRLQGIYRYQQQDPMVMKDKEVGYFSGLAGMSLNSYGVEDENHVAGSVELLGELRYHISQLLPGLSIGYNLNFEYVDFTDTRIDVNGDNFNPLPIENIRNHAWDVSLSRSLSTHWRYDFSTGYNLDSRTKDAGPFVLFNLVRDSLSNLQVGLNFEINQQLNRGENNSFTKIGAFLLWKL